MSRDTDVLAGRVGSETRTKKINKMLNEVDKAVAEAREAEKEGVLIRSRWLATKLNVSRSTITKNGFPDFFETYFDSIEYRAKKGIVISPLEQYVEERKEQREQVEELKNDE